MAHRKAGGSAKNLRDSQAQRLGVKLFGGQKAEPGMIILRQRGTMWFPGEGVKRGNDDTLYALRSGFVKFSRRKKIKFHGSLAWQKLVSVVDKNN